MRLRIWIEDEPLSADMEAITYLDIDLRGEWTLPQARGLVLDFARQAHDSLSPPEAAILEADPKVTAEQAARIREELACQARKAGRS